MTDEIEEAALELMQAVEDLGGAVAAIEQGFQKSEIERSAYRIALEIDSEERIVVGVNRFALGPRGALRAAARRPADRGASRCARLAALRADRDNDAVLEALQSSETRRPGTDNVLYPMKEALAAARHRRRGRPRAPRGVGHLRPAGRLLSEQAPTEPA